MKVTHCAAAVALALFVDVSRAHSRTNQGVLSNSPSPVDIQKHMLNHEHQELAGSLQEAMDFDGEDMNFLEVSAEVMEGAQILLELQDELLQLTDEADKETAIKKAFAKIKRLGRDVFEKSMRLLKSKGKQFLEKLKLQAKAGLHVMKEGAKEAGKAVLDELKTHASGALDLGAEILNDIASKGLKEGWQSGKDRIKTYGQEAVSSLGKRAEEAGKDLLQSAKSVFKSQVEEGVDLLKKSASELSDDFKEAFSGVREESQHQLENIADKAGENLALAYEDFKEEVLLLTKAANKATVDVVQAEDEVVQSLKASSKRPTFRGLRRKPIEEVETEAEEEVFV